MQLVFGRDAILNIKHITDWEHIRQRKQEHINENNKRENKNRREHQYALGDKVLLKARKKSKALMRSHKLMITVQFISRKES
jgi:hypothetical protein